MRNRILNRYGAGESRYTCSFILDADISSSFGDSVWHCQLGLTGCFRRFTSAEDAGAAVFRDGDGGRAAEQVSDRDAAIKTLNASVTDYGERRAGAKKAR